MRALSAVACRTLRAVLDARAAVVAADAIVFDGGGADNGVSSADDVKVLPLTAAELATSWDLG